MAPWSRGKKIVDKRAGECWRGGSWDRLHHEPTHAPAVNRAGALPGRYQPTRPMLAAEPHGNLDPIPGKQ